MKTYVIEYLEPQLPQKAIQADCYSIEEGMAKFYINWRLVASVPAHVVLIEEVRE